MKWLEIAVTCIEAQAEAVAERLRPFAHLESVAIEQWGDPSDLDPRALLPGVTVKIYLPATAVAATAGPAELRATVAAALSDLIDPAAALSIRQVADEDWSEKWKEGYRPFVVADRFLIQPSWLPPPAVPTDHLLLTLDPGMAFGTGLHATTQLCLGALAAYLPAGAALLDLGTGSGILAIAAARLGATRVLAVDNDEAAVAAARANITINDVQAVVQVEQGTLATVGTGRWPIVVANILAPVLVEMLAAGLLARVEDGGYLILSGLIDVQIPAVTQAVTAAGGRVVNAFLANEWVALVAQPGLLEEN